MCDALDGASGIRFEYLPEQAGVAWEKALCRVREPEAPRLRLAELLAPRPVQRPSREARASLMRQELIEASVGPARGEFEHHVAQVEPAVELVTSGRLEHGTKNGSALGAFTP